MDYNDLNAEQARQSVDVAQAYEAWRMADRDYRERFAGSMFWQTVDAAGRRYLYRELKGVKRSLGPQSDETEDIHRAFTTGREAVKERLRGITDRLNAMAPVNRALRLNRVPRLAARILRRLDEAGLLGKPFRVAGTHALYALEQACAVQIRSDLLATGDVDLLWDSRAGLQLSGGPALRMEGVLGLLRRVDRSFALARPGSFRAVNRDGYMVDLITPPFGDPVTSRPRSIGTGEDLTAIEIGGLAWLVNSPSFEQTAIGEDGYPLRMVTPDPRAWAVHKLWLAGRGDREPAKRIRDRAQAMFAIGLLHRRRPDLRFDAGELQALPQALRKAVLDIVEADGDAEKDAGEGSADGGLRPDW